MTRINTVYWYTRVAIWYRSTDFLQQLLYANLPSRQQIQTKVCVFQGVLKKLHRAPQRILRGYQFTIQSYMCVCFSLKQITENHTTCCN